MNTKKWPPAEIYKDWRRALSEEDTERAFVLREKMEAMHSDVVDKVIGLMAFYGYTIDVDVLREKMHLALEEEED